MAYDPNTILATCNIQSVKNKELQVSELIHDHAVDILILTETWLTNKDKSWCEVMNLNKNNFQLHMANRQNGRGDGLALICKSHYKIASLQKGSTKSFGYVTWRVTAKNRQLTVMGIYHPPYSAKNRITNKNFIDDFTIFTSNLVSEYSNNIIVGDFNFHVSNKDDLDAATFTDICEAFGFYQYVTFPTHTSENCLDLILTELSGNVNV